MCNIINLRDYFLLDYVQQNGKASLKVEEPRKGGGQGVETLKIDHSVCNYLLGHPNRPRM